MNPGLYFGRFLITNEISIHIISLFRFSIFSWFNCGRRKQQGSGSTSAHRQLQGFCLLAWSLVTGKFPHGHTQGSGDQCWESGRNSGYAMEYHMQSASRKGSVWRQVGPSSSAIWSTHVTFYQETENILAMVLLYSERPPVRPSGNSQVFIFLSYFMNRNWKMPRARNCILSLLPNPLFFFPFPCPLSSHVRSDFFKRNIILANFQEIKHRHNIIKSQCKERCLFQKQK